MTDPAPDPVLAAALRLEAAVDRLAAQLATPRAEPDSVPRAEVVALAERLDLGLARLRAALSLDEEAG